MASFMATVGNVKRYFIETSVPDAADLGDSLWNEDDAATRSDLNLVMDQYKLYVEMADRVSARRSLANTFFLTLNTAIFTAIGVFWKNPPKASPWLGHLPAHCAGAPVPSLVLDHPVLSPAQCRQVGRGGGVRAAAADVAVVVG